MQLEEAKKNLYEIIKLCEEELKNNDDNVSAILDLEDLKSLQTVLQALDNSIPKQVVEELLLKVEREEKANLKGLVGHDRYFVRQMYQNQRKPLEELLER